MKHVRDTMQHRTGMVWHVDPDLTPTCSEGYMVFLIRLEMAGRMRRCSSKVTMGKPSWTRRSNKDRSKSYPLPDSVCSPDRPVYELKIEDFNKRGCASTGYSFIEFHKFFMLGSELHGTCSSADDLLIADGGRCRCKGLVVLRIHPDQQGILRLWDKETMPWQPAKQLWNSIGTQLWREGAGLDRPLYHVLQRSQRQAHRDSAAYLQCVELGLGAQLLGIPNQDEVLCCGS